MVNYDTPRQWLNNFNWTDFYIHFHGPSRDLQT